MTQPDDTETQRLLAGRYRLEQLLGRGSMGAVWKAHDVVLRRSVAVKEVLLPPTQSDEENAVSRERALREARAIAALSHPNVVTLFDVVTDDGRPWVVMELVPARSLAAILTEDGPLPPVEAARIGLAVLAALDSAHEVGITHRDVKPGNILVSGDGRVKLADFGISRKVDESQLTRTGLMVGSPSYTAPEVARGREAGRAADIWGLGATLHCAVEGEPPFDLGDPVATLTAVVGDPPRPAPHAGPLAGILARCLDKDPRTRIRSEELRHALRSVAGPGGVLPGHPRSRPITTRAPATGSFPAPTGSRLPPPGPVSPMTGSRPPPTGFYPAATAGHRPPPGGGAGGPRPVTAGGFRPPPSGPVRAGSSMNPGSASSTDPRAATGPNARRDPGRGWVIGLSIALVAVILGGALFLLLSGEGSGAAGTDPSGTETVGTSSGPMTSTEPTGVRPASSEAEIDGTTASGAVLVDGTFHPFSFTIPSGWVVGKNEDDRTEFVEGGSDASGAGLVKVTIVAEALTAQSVDAQLDSQRPLLGSPARLADFTEVDYQVRDSGDVLWQYTNSTAEGSQRRGYLYAFEGPDDILWKVILAGPVKAQPKLLSIINPIVASIETQ